MEVYEKINLLIKEQGITKKEFSNKLRAIEPKLKTTGEPPSEKTVYGYLSGYTSISIELIPYIAEALRVTEQELFLTTYEKRIDFYKTMVATATKDEIDMIKQRLKIKDNFENIIEPNQDIENLINPLISKLEELKVYMNR
ncbi:MAG: hypothetical protein DRG78_06440 [Epsilonproteobacteria bacterium]|nr:MAG: hypothetical protein DRG78_06440 [Campylobacterota bacterium]